MSMSDEESLEERNLVNLVLYYKAKLKRIQKGVSAVKLLSVEERTRGNASIHVSLVLMVVYAVCIAAYGIGRPELRQSIAFFA